MPVERGIAVRLAAEDLVDGNCAGAAGHVQDTDGLTESFGQGRGETAGGEVGVSARICGDDKFDSRFGPGNVRLSGHLDGRVCGRGCFGRCRGSALAAGAQSHDHAERKNECKYFLHNFPPINLFQNLFQNSAGFETEYY